MAHQDLWAFSQEPSNFITNIACVVKHPNGKWFELACPVCHGNRSSDRRRGFFSAKGFYDHLRQGHGESNKGVKLPQIIERCQVRELSESEVEDLRKAGPDSIKSVATSTAGTQKKKKVRKDRSELSRVGADYNHGVEWPAYDGEAGDGKEKRFRVPESLKKLAEFEVVGSGKDVGGFAASLESRAVESLGVADREDTGAVEQ
ncbi:hypothetical protein LTR17_004734 [Elasticomyces elasticus]|nr:hypothetical protein LTR17_004734 [Elasticomyces elasticus]